MKTVTVDPTRAFLTKFAARACERTVAGCSAGQILNVFPTNQRELCNGLDDDCDGVVDNGVRCFEFLCTSGGATTRAATFLPQEAQIEPPSLILGRGGPTEPNQVCLNGGQLGAIGGGLGGNIGAVTRPGAGKLSPGDASGMCGRTHLRRPDGPQPRLSIDWGVGAKMIRSPGRMSSATRIGTPFPITSQRPAATISSFARQITMVSRQKFATKLLRLCRFTKSKNSVVDFLAA